MTAKEKAQELIDKMNVIHYVKLYGKNKDSKGLPVSMHNTQIKQCALIAVDEILQAESSLWEKASNMAYRLSYEQTTDFTYWEQVKQEIEKL
jgi:hypothetical protein